MKPMGIPQKSFRLPNVHHVPIAKFRFRFKSGDVVEAASELLHSSAVYRTLRHTATAAAIVRD